MGILTRFWVAMLTEDKDGAGTDDQIVLIINQEGVDKLHYTFPDTSQEDQEKGQANLYEVNVEGSEISSENFTASSIRIAIRGSDFWHPRHVLVWGEESSVAAPPLAVVRPLAWELKTEEGISTDSSEGNLSFPLRPIRPSSPNERIRQLLIILTTADAEDAGTDSEVEIEFTWAKGARKWVESLPEVDSPQWDLERGQANFYLGFPGEPQPRRNNLDGIVLRIKGNDRWSPSSLFVFAFPTITDFSGTLRHEFIMPLVHIPDWDLGPLSTDPSEGRESVLLPLVPIAK